MGEWESEFGSDAPSAVGGVLRQVMEGQMSRSMSDNQRATVAWYRANGDRERAHTVGVFLKRSRRKDGLPTLGVYVDSHAMATDFGVNKDIYLARLSNVGLEVGGIDFMVSRQPRERRSRRQEAERPANTTLPELSAAERAEVEELVADLPESVRAKAARAMELSLRRQKLG